MDNMKNRLLIVAVLGALSLLSSLSVSVASSNAHAFFDALQDLCGSRYEGEMTFPLDGQDSFAGKLLVAEFKQCNNTEVRVPFAVGDNKSRTWVFTKTESGARLKHDHRHAFTAVLKRVVQ